MKTVKILIVATLMVLSAGVNAQEVIAYKSVGTISSINGSDLGCSFALGDQVKACHTMLADEWDGSSDPNHGHYYGNTVEIELGNCWLEGGAGYLFVWNDWPGDHLYFSSSLSPSNVISWGAQHWHLEDSTESMLSSDAIPLLGTDFSIAEKYARVEAKSVSGDEVEVLIDIKTFYIDPAGCGATLEELLAELIGYVATIEDLQDGVSHSLDIKLQLILATVAYIQGNNINSAIAQIEAFIHEVEEQIGTNITKEQGDHMIAIAEEILALLLEL